MHVNQSHFIILKEGLYKKEKTQTVALDIGIQQQQVIMPHFWKDQLPNQADCWCTRSHDSSSKTTKAIFEVLRFPATREVQKGFVGTGGSTNDTLSPGLGVERLCATKLGASVMSIEPKGQNWGLVQG